MALLRYAAKCDPFLSLDCTRVATLFCVSLGGPKGRRLERIPEMRLWVGVATGERACNEGERALLFLPVFPSLSWQPRRKLGSILKVCGHNMRDLTSRPRPLWHKNRVVTDVNAGGKYFDWEGK